MTSLLKPIKRNLEYYYMSNGLTFAILNIILLGYDLKIACAKFQKKCFISDGEIDDKLALQNYQNEYGPGYSSVNLFDISNIFSGVSLYISAGHM